MQLRELVQNLPGATVDGPVDREVAGLTYDSRRVTPGMVFVAIPGQHVDGHEFVGTAVERGATAVICERNKIVPGRVTKIQVNDVREKAMEIRCLVGARNADEATELRAEIREKVLDWLRAEMPEMLPRTGVELP